MFQICWDENSSENMLTVSKPVEHIQTGLMSLQYAHIFEHSSEYKQHKYKKHHIKKHPSNDVYIDLFQNINRL